MNSTRPETAQISGITPNLALIFGLRPGNETDERLARLLRNPDSVCRCKFVYCRGNAAVFVGGMYLDTVGAEGEGSAWLAERAERCPEFPHLAEWAKSL